MDFGVFIEDVHFICGPRGPDTDGDLIARTLKPIASCPNSFCSYLTDI